MRQALKVSHSQTAYAGGGRGFVAYVSPDQNPSELESNFDAQRTIDCLTAAANSLRCGDGIRATEYAGEAWARISAFHHS